MDPGVDSLKHLHDRTLYRAKNGSNGNTLIGSQGSVK